MSKVHNKRRKLFCDWWTYQLADAAVEMPQTKVTSEGIDRRKRVLEVTAACAEETASNIYTLTCNMSQHLGKKPLFDALNNFTKDADRHFPICSSKLYGIFRQNVRKCFFLQAVYRKVTRATPKKKEFGGSECSKLRKEICPMLIAYYGP